MGPPGALKPVNKNRGPCRSSIFMTVRKMPKMNVEWVSSSSPSPPDISVPPTLSHLKMLRFQ